MTVKDWFTQIGDRDIDIVILNTFDGQVYWENITETGHNPIPNDVLVLQIDEVDLDRKEGITIWTKYPEVAK